jgi:adenylate cyclase
MKSDDQDEFRLFLGELCCDLCRFEHLATDDSACNVNMRREFYLGSPGAFADLRVEVGHDRPYFVEVKYGLPDDLLVRRLQRKYGPGSCSLLDGTKIIVMVDVQGRADWRSTEQQIREAIHPGMELEIWSEEKVSSLVRDRFGVTLEGFNERDFVRVRGAINAAKSLQAFGGMPADSPLHPLKSALLWHFGFWHLRQLRLKDQRSAREVLSPGLYSNIVVVLADLCSFSSYVRDTPDERIVRESLTSFYSKARYQIINNGGMLYQFVGDEVIALYGLSGNGPGYVQAAIDTAYALLDIGDCVSHHWQRHIDRVQSSSGVHIGMAAGALQIVSLQPFGRTYMGAVGDVINMSARLTGAAGPGEIVISNTLHGQLSEDQQCEFQEMDSFEGKNVGQIKSWKRTRIHKEA